MCFRTLVRQPPPRAAAITFGSAGRPTSPAGVRALPCRGLLVGGCLVSLLAAGPAVAAAKALAATEAGEPQRRPVPRPFPRPSPPASDPGAAPPRAESPLETPSAAETPAAAGAPGAAGTPTAETLGLPVYPASQFIASYDAGRQQRYYLFGANSDFDAMVRYYGNVLRERGNRVFDAPPTHVFEVGRFREREMAFPPGVTIKDYAWNGSEGYPDPAGGRFRTIIQIVPPPPGSSR